jgi:osmoprotectant transport system substrate-binding protein
MKRSLALLAGLLVLAACGGGSGDPLSPGAGGQPSAAGTIKIGSADFPENRLLAEIYAQTLESKGLTVERSFGIGSREVYFPGLTDGSIDLIPDYTGVLLQYVNPQAPETAPDAVYSALQAQVPAPLTVLDRSAAENKDAVVITAETAQRLGARSIADLAPACGELVFGGPSEFQTRPDGLPGLTETYGCTFREFRALDTGGPLTVAALEDGTVQVANLFTTDPIIPDKGFVVLEDPQNNFAAQNVVPLINKAKASQVVTTTLNDVSSRLTTENLTALNAEAASDAKPSPETVAKNWLSQNGLA